MDVKIQEKILSIVVLNKAGHKVKPGGVPVFMAADEEEQEKLGLFLSRILNGMVHDLENGVYIIVKH